MGDLQFAKQFLTTLDNKSTKYKPDHVFDPKTFQTRVPYTLPKLPHPPYPLPPKTAPSAAPVPGAEPDPTSRINTITLILKSNRNPSMSLTLSSLPPISTTIQSVKEHIQSHLGGSGVASLEKIKVLINKKPIPASKKTVAEALDAVPDAANTVEFGVMVMGGALDPPPQSQPIHIHTEPASVATATSAPESEKAAAEATTTTSEPMEGIEKTLSPTTPIQPGEASGREILDTADFWNDLQGYLEQRIKDVAEAGRLRTVFEKSWKTGATKQ